MCVNGRVSSSTIFYPFKIYLHLYTYLLNFSFVCRFTCSDQRTTWGESVLGFQYVGLRNQLGGEFCQQMTLFTKPSHRPPPLFFGTGSLIELGWTSWPVSSGNASCVVFLSTRSSHSAIYMGEDHMLSCFLLCLSVSACGAGDQTHDLEHAGQASPLWATPPTLTSFFVLFWYVA